MGVSNWGAYALLGALGVLRPDKAETLTHTLIPNLDRSSLRTDVPFGEVLPQQRRGFGKEYAFFDADPAMGAKQEEVQKWLFKLWESRQK